MPMTTLTDQHAHQMRVTFAGAVPHTLFTALIWIVAGCLAVISTPLKAILFFIIGGTFTFPGGELIRKSLGTRNVLSTDNRLPLFFTLLAFTIPLSYPLIYFICKANVNLFFPAFTILIGAHYLPFVYGYQMKSFALLSILLVGSGTITGLYFNNSFAMQAFLTGSALLVFAFIHFIQIKRELYEQ
jgi:hypothetical protein